ncbi:MAG: PaaI family thioesterase [Steroidobacteraceae bacterium]
MTLAFPAGSGVAPPEVLRQMSGLDFLQAILDGRLPHPPIMVTLGYGPVELASGRVVFEAALDGRAYNPIGVIHGGFAATLLDTVTACAVHSTLPAGTGYTTVELKVNYLRPLVAELGTVRAVGQVISSGRRTALATGELFDADGKLCGWASSTCMVMPL